MSFRVRSNNSAISALDEYINRHRSARREQVSAPRMDAPHQVYVQPSHVHHHYLTPVQTSIHNHRGAPTSESKLISSPSDELLMRKHWAVSGRGKASHEVDDPTYSRLRRGAAHSLKEFVMEYKKGLELSAIKNVQPRSIQLPHDEQEHLVYKRNRSCGRCGRHLDRSLYCDDDSSDGDSTEGLDEEWQELKRTIRRLERKERRAGGLRQSRSGDSADDERDGGRRRHRRERSPRHSRASTPRSARRTPRKGTLSFAPVSSKYHPIYHTPKGLHSPRVRHDDDRDSRERGYDDTLEPSGRRTPRGPPGIWKDKELKKSPSELLNESLSARHRTSIIVSSTSNDLAAKEQKQWEDQRRREQQEKQLQDIERERQFQEQLRLSQKQLREETEAKAREEEMTRQELARLEREREARVKAEEALLKQRQDEEARQAVLRQKEQKRAREQALQEERRERARQQQAQLDAERLARQQAEDAARAARAEQARLAAEAKQQAEEAARVARAEQARLAADARERQAALVPPLTLPSETMMVDNYLDELKDMSSPQFSRPSLTKFGENSDSDSVPEELSGRARKLMQLQQERGGGSALTRLHLSTLADDARDTTSVRPGRSPTPRSSRSASPRSPQRSSPRYASNHSSRNETPRRFSFAASRGPADHTADVSSLQSSLQQVQSLKGLLKLESETLSSLAASKPKISRHSKAPSSDSSS